MKNQKELVGTIGPSRKKVIGDDKNILWRVGTVWLGHGWAVIQKNSLQI